VDITPTTSMYPLRIGKITLSDPYECHSTGCEIRLRARRAPPYSSAVLFS